MSSYSRRQFLDTVSRASLFTSLPSWARAASALKSDTVTLSILHTTDLHGHILPTTDYAGHGNLGGLARCATQIRRWRRKNRNTVLIDIGDVYQGTEVALRTGGRLMLELFNHLKYDAWVVGNHEFDWGMEAFRNALRISAMPVLAANTSLAGEPVGRMADLQNPFSRLRPYIIKEIEGIRIAIIGLTTPGMPFWFRPEFTRGLDFQYPVEPVRRAVREAKGEGAHAIVLAGHMGLKPRTGGDDFANNVMSLTSEFPEAAVFIGGHTHQTIPSRLTNNVLFTQADHFGIHLGRVDLVFDRASKRLLRREARCERMDHRLRPDPVVLSRAKSELAQSAAALAEPIGELAESLSVAGEEGESSDLARMIGTAIIESLRAREIPVEGALHGVFDDRKAIPAGYKTVRDVWSMIPYENGLVTAHLLAEELVAVLEETYATREQRSLVGFNVKTEGRGMHRRVTSLTQVDGRPLERGKRFPIAFNTFDSRSAGHRFMKLRDLLENPSTNCRLHEMQTRDTIIEFFRRHRVVHRPWGTPRART